MNIVSNDNRNVHPDDDKMGKPYIDIRKISWSLILRRVSASLVFVLSVSKLLVTRKNTFRSKWSVSKQYNLTQYPRMVEYDEHNDQPQHLLSTKHGRIIDEWTEENEERQNNLWNDKHFDRAWVQPFTGYEMQPHCKPMHDWQLHHSPTCNLLHEYSLRWDETYKYLASGWYRSTFEIDDAVTTAEKDRVMPAPIAMKTIKLKEVFFNPNLRDRHRVDALIYEKTTASKYILNMYAFCAFSGLHQFAAGGTLMDDTLRPNGSSWLRKEKLETAIEVVSSLADLHTIESKDGFAAMSHTDIMLDQWLWTDEGYKLNDFNRGHLIYWDEEKRESCPYLWNENNPGYFRAPEEYKMEEQTEKIDVYSLGNVIYSILTGLYPFDDLEMEDAQKKVMNGETPPIPVEYLKSNHPIDKALVQAMKMCWVYNWQDRANASDVRDFLMNTWKSVENLNDDEQ